MGLLRMRMRTGTGQAHTGRTVKEPAQKVSTLYFLEFSKIFRAILFPFLAVIFFLFLDASDASGKRNFIRQIEKNKCKRTQQQEPRTMCQLSHVYPIDIYLSMYIVQPMYQED